MPPILNPKNRFVMFEVKLKNKPKSFGLSRATIKLTEISQ